MSRVTGTRCPKCGSTNTYTTMNNLMCRAHGCVTPLNQIPGYNASQYQGGEDQQQPERLPPQQSGDPMTDVYLHFGN